MLNFMLICLTWSEFLFYKKHKNDKVLFKKKKKVNLDLAPSDHKYRTSNELRYNVIFAEGYPPPNKCPIYDTEQSDG